MFANLSIKSRLVFMVAFMSVLLFAIGGWGLGSLNSAKSTLKSVYENRMVALGELEEDGLMLVAAMGTLVLTVLYFAALVVLLVWAGGAAFEKLGL